MISSVLVNHSLEIKNIPNPYKIKGTNIHAITIPATPP